MIVDKYFEHRERAFTKACMPLFFDGSGKSSGRDTVQAQRERELERGSQQHRDRALWIKERREESARNVEQDKRELREARAAKIAGVATKKQLLIIKLAEIKETSKEQSK